MNQVDHHILIAVSGHIADSRTLVNYARSEAQMHRFNYNESISVKAITQAVSDLALNFGEGDMTTKRKPISRPYGVVLLVAGVDEFDGPCLYQIEPSGTMIGYNGRIIGPADERQSFLAEKYDENATLEETEKLALIIMKDAIEEKITKDLVQLSVIPTATRKHLFRSAEYVDNILKTIPEFAA